MISGARGSEAYSSLSGQKQTSARASRLRLAPLHRRLNASVSSLCSRGRAASRLGGSGPESLATPRPEMPTAESLRPIALPQRAVPTRNDCSDRVRLVARQDGPPDRRRRQSRTGGKLLRLDGRGLGGDSSDAQVGAGFRAVAHVVPRQGSGRSASEPIIAEVEQRVPRRWPAEDVLRPSFQSPREYYTRTWWRFFHTADPNPRLQLLSVLHYGFGQDEYWSTRQNPQYTAPEVLKRRIADVIKPLLSNIRADGRPNAPDYVEFAPGTWDLARWAEQDMAAQRNTNEPLSPDRLAWFRN